MLALHLLALGLGMLALLLSAVTRHPGRGWALASGAVMTAAMLDGLVATGTGRPLVPAVAWSASLAGLAIAAAPAARRAGRAGLDVVRVPLGALAMSVLVLASSAGHRDAARDAVAATHAHAAGTIAAIVIVALLAQCSLCVAELTRGGGRREPGRRRALRTADSLAMTGSGLAMGIGLLAA